MKRAIIIFIVVIVFFVVKLFYQAGQFKWIDNYFTGSDIVVYNNMPGPEDMQVDYQTGLLFISATNRRKMDPNSTEDGIYLFDTRSQALPKLLPTTFTGEFHPHGISLLRIDTSLYVFAVNHNSQGEFIERFKFEKNALTHLTSYSSAKMCCPNDVVAMDIDKFYVTNDHGTNKGLMRTLEDYLRIARSSIVYFNGNEFTTEVKSILYANGINKSLDNKFIYAASTTGGSLLVYSIGSNGSLIEHHIEELGTGVDNIDIDEDGNLWIGAHPKLLDFVSHAKDSTNISPSQVLKLVAHDNNQSFTVKEIYMNDGSEISASSVAVYYKKELFIGVVLDYSLLRAKMNIN